LGNAFQRGFSWFKTRDGAVLENFKVAVPVPEIKIFLKEML
jgi:hypothetical protein